MTWDSWLTEKTYPDRFSPAKIEVSSPQALDPVCPTVRMSEIYGGNN
ncbi:MAG: hypothetical protein WBM86_20020 [Waterburya sp.]